MSNEDLGIPGKNDSVAFPGSESYSSRRPASAGQGYLRSPLQRSKSPLSTIERAAASSISLGSPIGRPTASGQSSESQKPLRPAAVVRSYWRAIGTSSVLQVLLRLERQSPVDAGSAPRLRDDTPRRAVGSTRGRPSAPIRAPLDL